MTTDFEKYAKRAVNMDILYFLDKPIDNDELVLALNKFERKYLSAQNQISIKNTEGHFFLKLDDIVYILSDGNYCEIYRKHNRMMKVSKSLKEIETLLSAPFIRIHSNCIINAKFVEMINTTEKIVRLNLEDAKTKEKVSVRISNTYLKSVKNQLLTARKY